MRIGSLACAAALVATVTLAPSVAIAADVGPTPPAAVVASLRPGGAAFQDAVRLGASNETGAVDLPTLKKLAASATFGTPRLYYYYWAPTSTVSEAAAFTDADFSLGRGTRWLAVELQDGVPFSMVEVGNDGAIAAVGGWSPESLRTISSLPASAIVMTDGRYGEEYAISGNRQTISALNGAATSLIGGTPTDATTFRRLKDRQAAEHAEDPQPAGAVGGGPGPSSSTTDVPVATTLGITAAALLVTGLYLLLGRRRARRRPAGATVVSSESRG